MNMTFASLFSGCGGFDLGMLKVGYRARGGYDIDKLAVANFSANLRRPVWLGDLREGIPNERDLKGVDVLVAGPPCQGFSTAGTRRIDDARNLLLTTTGVLALRIRPRVLVVENVAGALSGAHAVHWRTLDAMMRHGGYRTNTLLCECASLGMAQLRKRALLFAWNTQREIDFAFPTRSPSTLSDVLARVEGCRNHDAMPLTKGSKDWHIATQIHPGQKLCNVRAGENSVPTWRIPEVFGKVTRQEQTVLELLRRLRRQDRTRDRGDADPVSFNRLREALGHQFQGLVERLIRKGYVRRVRDGVDLVGTFNGKFRRLRWDRSSLTVDTRFGSHRYFLHPAEHRGFTVREAARIQGFHDNYHFIGGDSAQYRLIGNAVPPPLGALAGTLARRLL